MKERMNPKSMLVSYAYFITKKGVVLDLGCGEGLNSIFLLEQGFDVVAVDNSSERLSYMKENLKKSSFAGHFNIICCDLRSFSFIKQFSAIVCTDVLHFLPKEESIKLIQSMKKNTVIGGINFISVFLPRGDLCSSKLYFFNTGELKNIYSDWEVIFYDENMKLTHKKDEVGNPKTQEVASIVARRLI